MRTQSGADFPHYVRDLKEIGVNLYDTFVSDGTSVYFGANNHSVKSAAKYPTLAVAGQSSAEALLSSARTETEDARGARRRFICRSPGDAAQTLRIVVRTLLEKNTTKNISSLEFRGTEFSVKTLDRNTI